MFYVWKTSICFSGWIEPSAVYNFSIGYIHRCAVERFGSFFPSLSLFIILFLLKCSRCFSFIECMHLCVSGRCCCWLDSKSRCLTSYKWMRLYVRMRDNEHKMFICKLKESNKTNYCAFIWHRPFGIRKISEISEIWANTEICDIIELRFGTQIIFRPGVGCVACTDFPKSQTCFVLICASALAPKYKWVLTTTMITHSVNYNNPLSRHDKKKKKTCIHFIWQHIIRDASSWWWLSQKLLLQCNIVKTWKMRFYSFES